MWIGVDVVERVHRSLQLRLEGGHGADDRLGELADPAVVDQTDRHRVEVVALLAADLDGRHEIRLLQHAQVLHDPEARHVRQVLAQLPERLAIALEEPIEQDPPIGIGEGPEGRRHGGPSCGSLYVTSLESRVNRWTPRRQRIPVSYSRSTRSVTLGDGSVTSTGAGALMSPATGSAEMVTVPVPHDDLVGAIRGGRCPTKLLTAGVRRDDHGAWDGPWRAFRLGRHRFDRADGAGGDGARDAGRSTGRRDRRRWVGHG